MQGKKKILCENKAKKKKTIYINPKPVEHSLMALNKFERRLSYESYSGRST